MRVRSLLFLFLVIATVAQLADAQNPQSIERKAKGKVVNPDEMVSFKSDVPYTKAIQSLGELSRKLEGRLVIDRSPMQGKDKTIGINIESMYWKDALELILRSNQLWYIDYPEYMEITSFEDIGKKQGEASSKEMTSSSSIGGPIPSRGYMAVDSSEQYAKMRDISISCVFFDLNRTKLAEEGMDISIFRGSNMNLGINLYGATNPMSKSTGGTTSLSTSSRLTNVYSDVNIHPTGKDLGVDIYAALRMFEADQLGETISNSKVPVRSGLSSTLQIGDDFSVLEKDFSGNTIQKFYPTGTILKIKPRIFKVGDMEFIDIQYEVEKSTFEASSLTTIIHKTSTRGSLTLLNGEESYIGGMYSNSETVVRQGVPLLKDLPWWFFGLRYIFGYESKNITKRELIVILKAEILPSLEDRAIKLQTGKNVIEESREEYEKDINKRRTDK
jgi:general secretion pathway protein D